MKAVSEGELDPCSPGFVAQMSECLDCRACEAACPSGVPYGELIAAARARIHEAQAPTESSRTRRLRSFLLGTLFARMDIFRFSARLLRFAQITGLVKLANLVGLGDAAKLAPSIAKQFFTPAGQRYDAAPSVGLAFLHAGCVMQVAFPNVHQATIRMLRRVGLSVVVPKAQGCCGALAVHSGEPEIARAFAKRNIVAFEESHADVYVVNAAGCGSSLKEYDALLADDPAFAARAKQFSARVRDVIEVLDAMVLDTHIGRIDATVTYQEACQLAHAQRVTGAPRRLLAKIPGLRLVEMNESALCCGSAGTYNLTQPEMAARLGERKIANIAATNADIVATANPGCAMQVAAGLRADRRRTRVAHVVELLDEAYANYTEAPIRA